MSTAPHIFSVTFVALYVGHMVGDHWVQTDAQARAKGGPGWPGHRADLAHVASLTVTQLACLLLALLVLDLAVPDPWIAAGLAVNAVTHYWADRRHTLAALAALIPGKATFYRLGMPRPGRDDNPSLGTGAYALDQAWHIGWLFLAALIVSAGAR